ncbi:MAG: hypothetical protein F6J93_37640 [Oscillatoria sp. SIO1A7]|nr:hypothetical protein [Oscillatoria sp. SIO1A7]
MHNKFKLSVLVGYNNNGQNRYIEDALQHPNTLAVNLDSKIAFKVLDMEGDREVYYAPRLGDAACNIRLVDAVVDIFAKMHYRFPIEKLGSTLLSDPGLSRLLNVTIAVLKAEQNNLLVLRHPDIYLHPFLQGKLADFILAQAVAGKSFLVETHSECFVDRLRRRVAEDINDELKDKIGIFRAWQNQIKLTRINRYGVIEGKLFDFSAADEAAAIFEATLQKKRHEPLDWV